MNTEHDWLMWWHDEGSGMRPVNGQDHEEHVRDMTRIAWLNGAFGAADEIDRLRGEIDKKSLVIKAMTEALDEVVRAANKLTAERDEARRRTNSILTELDCRIEHGAESNGHLEAILSLFKENTNV